MQIADVLMPALEGHFPDRGLLRGESSEHVATFPAIHPAVGDVKLIADGGEITIVLGSHTHSHFNPYDSSLSPEELAKEVTDSVVDFLQALFADRVLIWASRNGGSGGWARLDLGEPPSLRADSSNFVWSGPIDTLDRAG